MCTNWLECSECNVFVNTYIPQEHQEELHKDPARFIGNFGGYGSGKTTTSYEEVLKHVLITPNANVLIGANIASQYEQTIKRDLEADLPAKLVAEQSSRYAYIDLINGARIMYRPFDDPDKLRSLNLTMFVITEGSEVKPEVFIQLKTRLRNLAASVQAKDMSGNPMWQVDEHNRQKPILEAEWYKGIIESNPDPGWVRLEVLYNSGKIRQFGKVIEKYDVDPVRADPAISSYITGTDANYYLPKDFIPNNVKNKPAWWVARFIYGSFTFSETLVYPNALRNVVDDIPIPKEWKRIAAHDYGLADDSVFLFGAIDEQEGILYIYKEIRTNNRSVEELADLFKAGSADIPTGGWLCTPLIDPKSGSQRGRDKKKLIDLYLEYDVAFQPGAVSVDARILRLNTYIEAKKIKIFRSCEGLINELRDYKFKTTALGSSAVNNKPEDKNNHGINALEWICMELPADPKNLVYGVYNKLGVEADLEQEYHSTVPFPIRDEEEYRTNEADLAYNINYFQEG